MVSESHVRCRVSPRRPRYGVARLTAAAPPPSRERETAAPPAAAWSVWTPAGPAALRRRCRHRSIVGDDGPQTRRRRRRPGVSARRAATQTALRATTAPSASPVCGTLHSSGRHWLLEFDILPSTTLGVWPCRTRHHIARTMISLPVLSDLIVDIFPLDMLSGRPVGNSSGHASFTSRTAMAIYQAIPPPPLPSRQSLPRPVPDSSPMPPPPPPCLVAPASQLRTLPGASDSVAQTAWVEGRGWLP